MEIICTTWTETQKARTSCNGCGLPLFPNPALGADVCSCTRPKRRTTRSCKALAVAQLPGGVRKARKARKARKQPTKELPPAASAEELPPAASADELPPAASADEMLYWLGGQDGLGGLGGLDEQNLLNELDEQNLLLNGLDGLDGQNLLNGLGGLEGLGGLDGLEGLDGQNLLLLNEPESQAEGLNTFDLYTKLLQDIFLP
jgi:hypothetical protein